VFHSSLLLVLVYFLIESSTIPGYLSWEMSPCKITICHTEITRGI